MYSIVGIFVSCVSKSKGITLVDVGSETKS